MIRHYLLIFLAVFFLSNVSAQGSITYLISVRDNQGKAMSNFSISAIEKRTFERKIFVTDAAGKATIFLDSGEEWSLNIGDMKNYKHIEIPERGASNGSGTVTYDLDHWNRINQKPVDRSTLAIQTIAPTKATGPTKTEAFLTLTVKSSKGTPWKSLDVNITDIKGLKTYLGKTNSSGKVSFLLPKNTTYEIDIDGELNMDYCDMNDWASAMNKTITYEKIDFEESLSDDNFIVQKFKEEPKGTSSRVCVKVKVAGGPNDGANEFVYLDMTYSSNRYKAKTNKDGEAIFLLPQKRDYLVSFDFQRNVDVLSLRDFRGIGNCQRSFYYEPNPRLQFPENYLPTHDNILDYNPNNYLTTIYPKTADNELINVHAKWGNEKINSGSVESILEIGFSANKPPKSKTPSKPVNISFVLDKSGSMSGESFDLLIKSMLEFIDKLSANDRCSLVFFDNEAVVAFKQQTVGNKQAIKDILQTVQAGGGTNIYDGLAAGYKELEKNFSPEYSNRVILLTDGYGSKPIDYIIEQSKAYFKKGITVSTIGVGADYNSALLSQLSEYSGGLQHHALEANSINSALMQEFESLFYPIAEKLEVEVKYNNKIVYKKLYGVPESSNSNNKVAFELNHVYSSLNKLAMIKFKLEQPNASIEQEKIIITVRYRDLVNQKDVEIVKEKSLDWTEETNLELLVDGQQRDLYSTAVINQSLKAIADLCDDKNYEQARKNLTETYKYIKRMNNDKLSAELTPIVNDIELYLEALNHVLKK